MNTLNDLSAEFQDQFMQPEIWKAEYTKNDTMQGTFFIDQDLTGLYPFTSALVEFWDGIPVRDIYSKEYYSGYLCRLSAPGYLDCTDTVGFETEQECINYLLEVYGKD